MKLLTPTNAARYLGIGVSTLRTWAAQGRIAKTYVDGQPFYAVRDLDRLKRPKRGRPKR